MIKAAHWVVTVLILLLGAVHTGMGFYCKELSEGTLWFIGAGIAITFAGLFNLAMILTPVKPVRIIALVVNAAMAGLFVYAAQVLHGAQVYIGIVLFVIAAALTFIRRAV